MSQWPLLPVILGATIVDLTKSHEIQDSHAHISQDVGSTILNLMKLHEIWVPPSWNSQDFEKSNMAAPGSAQVSLGATVPCRVKQ